eukprot:6349491-Pyramimonas_sp.AAC.1
MCHAVCSLSCPTPLAVKANVEDVSGGALVSKPLMGSRQECFHGPGLNIPEGTRQRCLHGPVRGQFAGISQAVCSFSCPTPLAVRADFEDV